MEEDMDTRYQFRYKNYFVHGKPKDNIIWIKIIGNEGGWAICFDDWSDYSFKTVAINHINNQFIENDKTMGRI